MIIYNLKHIIIDIIFYSFHTEAEKSKPNKILKQHGIGSFSTISSITF